MKKIYSLILILVLGLTIFSGCGEKKVSEETTTAAQSEKKDVNVAALKGATAIGMIEIMENAEKGTASHNYDFSLYGTADEITAGLIKGEIDMAAVPCNLSSVLYNKTEGEVQLAAVNTLGVLYIVQTGDQIQSVEDLKGKTIYSTGKGTTPEYTLNYLLSSYGLTPGTDVFIEYKTEAAEVVATLATVQDGVAMLPQPFVATAMMQNDQIKIALDISEEWEKLDEESTVVTGVFVVRKEFANKNPEVVSAFLSEYNDSIDFVNEDIDTAAALVEKFDIFKAAVAKKAVPYMNISFLEGEEMKSYVQGYLKTLFDQNPASIGGNMPEDDFYYFK